MSEDIKAPERLWLQTAGDYAGAVEAAMASDTGVTWCENSVDEHDAEYIRADIAAAEIESLRAALEAIYQVTTSLADPEHICGWVEVKARAALVEKGE